MASIVAVRWFAPSIIALLALVACGRNEDASTAGPPQPANESRQLNIYSWADYVAPDTISNFENETGIKVNYDTFEDNEVLETKLLTGHSGYDIVVPSTIFLERQIKAGVFLKLDKSKLPNLKNLDPEIVSLIARWDPGNEHGIVWHWGTVGIGYNVKKVKAALGDVHPDSWSLILDPANAQKLQKCGITLLDAPVDVVQSVLIYLGSDPNRQNVDDLNAAVEVLKKVRPYIKYFRSTGYYEDLAAGEVCLSLGWSGDIFLAKARADEARTDIALEYYIPKEGAGMWADVLAIPADAPHPNNAHLFLDYAMRPQVMAAVTNFDHYANGNAASLPFVNDAIKNNPSIYPPAAIRAKLFIARNLTQEYSRRLNRAWIEIQTGQ